MHEKHVWGHPSTQENGNADGTLDVEMPSPDLVAGNYLLSVSRKKQFSRAALTGLAAGGIAVLFQIALDYAEQGRIAMFHLLGSYSSWGWIVMPILCAALAAAAGYLTANFAPDASGSGIPHIRAVLAGKSKLHWRALLPIKFAGGILGLGAGLSLGREGPTVQMGACVGEAISEKMKLDRRSRRNLIASAAGAGLGAAFNAPLAGFIFVIEELQRELSPLTFMSALIASVTAVAVSRIFTGQLPSFHIHNFPLPPMTALPLLAIVGLVAGYAGVFFNKTLLFSIRNSRKLTLKLWQKCAVAGAITGLVGWWMPEALGGGHRIAEAILRGDFMSRGFVGFLIGLLLVKFVLTMIGYSSGAPGGVFAPLLVFGAIIGQLIGLVSMHLFPHSGATPAAYAVIGMAAMFTAIVRAPFTGIILILEMTGNQEQLFALILACVIAYLVAEHARDAPLYDALMELDLEQGEPETVETNEPHTAVTTVQSHSAMDGATIGSLTLPSACIATIVRRGNQELIASPELELLLGDQVLAVLPSSSVEEFKKMGKGAHA